MSDFPDHFENMILDHVLGVGAGDSSNGPGFVAPSFLYFSLFTDYPGDGNANEYAAVVDARAGIPNTVEYFKLRATGDKDSITNQRGIVIPFVGTGPEKVVTHWACYSSQEGGGSGTTTTSGGLFELTATTYAPKVGMLVTGDGIPPGTYVVAAAGGSVTMSRKATGTEMTTNVPVSFSSMQVARGKLASPVTFGPGEVVVIPAGSLNIGLASYTDAGSFSGYGKRRLLSYLFGRAHPYPSELIFVGLGTGMDADDLTGADFGVPVTFNAASGGTSSAYAFVGNDFIPQSSTNRTHFALKLGRRGRAIFLGRMKSEVGTDTYGGGSYFDSAANELTITFD